MSPPLDLIAIGRVSVDLYGQQIGARLEDVATFAKALGGCPANVAIGTARLGLKSALITRVGKEPMGRFVQEQLAREGVDTSGVRVDPQRLTSLVLLSVRDAQTFPLIFYRDNCADTALCEEDIEEEFIGSARSVLVTGTHFSMTGPARAQRKAIAAAKARRRTVVLDIDYRPNLWGIGGHDAGDSRYVRSPRVTGALAPILPDCDLIVGTEEELHVAAGIEDTLGAIRHIRSRSDAVIVCKRGARGCVVFAGAIPATLEDGLVAAGLDIEIYNVLGAGDAFLAGFLKGYLRGAPHEESARLANACGALAVSRLLCSAEFPTRAELEHFLTHGSRHRALRDDARLNHLHRVTTRRPAPTTLQVLAIPDRAQFEELAAPVRASPAQLDRFAQLAIDAVAGIAAGREGFGVSLDGGQGRAAFPQAMGGRLWLARAVHRPLDLTEWPLEVTVHGRCKCHPEDPPQLRADRQRRLRELAETCRAQGRELLLEIAAGEWGVPGADALSELLSRIYALDIRPDWWLLGPPPSTAAFEPCARVISANDAHCRGVLLRLAADPQPAAALTLAAGTPLVRGFVAGGSIFAGAARAWLAGQLPDEVALASITERFKALVEAWFAARDHPPVQRQRSAT